MPAPIPPPPSVSPGAETGPNQLLAPPPASGTNSAEASARPLQPGAGEVFIPPPPIPPIPPGLEALQRVEPGIALKQQWTLEDLEKIACENNPILGQARVQVEGTFGKAIQAGRWPIRR